MKLVDALTVTLRDWDLRYVFGVSGANIEHLHDSIHRLGDGRLRAIMAKSEVGAAFMADARARVHRTLGVCCATSGGGMLNLAVGIAESFAESVPVLAIVGQIPTSLEGRGGFQDSSGLGRSVDAASLFRAMTKYTARVDGASGFWEKLYAAVKTAITGRPGPVVLLIPRDVYELEVGAPPSWFPATLDELLRPSAPSASSLDALYAAIAGSARPVIVVGTGVLRSAFPEAVRDFAEVAGVPVVTTMASHGAFPHESPLFLGTIGAAGHPSAHAYLNDEADLVVAVGTGLNVMTRHPIGRALTRARVAVVNIDPGEILRTIDPAIVVEGDAGVVFEELLDRFQAAPFAHAPAKDYALTRYRAVLADETEAGASKGSPLLQSEAIELLETYLPDAGHVLFDAGNCAAAALHGLSIPRGVSSTIALGMGGMGYAIAGAIGAQLGETNARRSVVVCGDGAFLMLGLEIHTAVELGLPILFVVFNNQKHGMCVTRQKLFFEGRVECAEYSGVDVATASRGLGPREKLWVGRASSRGELAARLAEYDAVAAMRPGVLELCLAREEVPPFSPFLDRDAETFVVRHTKGAFGPRRERPAA